MGNRCWVIDDGAKKTFWGNEAMDGWLIRAESK